MDIEYEIKGDNINVTNVSGEKMLVCIDLKNVWEEISSKYTHLYIATQLQIPVGITALGERLIMDLNHSYVIAELEEQKVHFSMNCPYLVDSAREPLGSVVITGYKIKKT